MPVGLANVSVCVQVWHLLFTVGSFLPPTNEHTSKHALYVQQVTNTTASVALVIAQEL